MPHHVVPPVGRRHFVNGLIAAWCSAPLLKSLLGHRARAWLLRKIGEAYLTLCKLQIAGLVAVIMRRASALFTRLC